MIVPPGSTIGIVGGGQLGRMLALAAAQLGYRCHIYAPDEVSPAAEVSHLYTRGDYADEAGLTDFAAQVDVVTYEFENIPAGPLAALAGRAPLFPSPAALETAQDRLSEKAFVTDLGGTTAPYAPVGSREELDAALAEIGTPALLKTRRFGYDGKGQARINSPADADAAWAALNGAPAILEGLVAFDAEFSLLLCRGRSGDVAIWDAPRNEHVNGILSRSVVPGGDAIAPVAAEAKALACRIAGALD